METKRPDTSLLLGLWRAILADYAAVYPVDKPDCEKDYIHLTRLLEKRGIGFFTLDLPLAGAIFDRALDEGRLPVLQTPGMTRRWNRSPIPKLFSAIWLRCFDRNGYLLDNVDPFVILILRTLLNGGKKVRMETTNKRKYSAYKEYFDIESQLEPVSDFWDQEPSQAQTSDTDRFTALASDTGLFTTLTPLEREFWANLDRVAGEVSTSLGFFSPDEVVGRHGPGSVSDLSRRNVRKYEFPTWSPRLESLFPWSLHAQSSYDSNLENSVPVWHPSEEEYHSSLFDVPKTQKGPRLIAKEPTGSQWIQQGVTDLLRQAVQRSPIGACIDFFDQEPSRQLVLRASRDGRSATIDLSSASDRLTANVVSRTFRANLSLLRILNATRTRYIRNTIDRTQPDLLKIRKFAAMGSALTFPIQSIVFSTIALGTGSFLTKRSWRELVSEVRVYGDDIIIPVAWVETFNKVLERLGLQVNTRKSYSGKNFRESCGMDAFRGDDVTPAYVRWLKAGPQGDSLAGYIETCNNFFRKGLWRASNFLATAGHVDRKVAVVPEGSPCLGLVSFCRNLSPSLLRRRKWDEATQQWRLKVPRITVRKERPITEDPVNGTLEFFTTHRRAPNWRDILFPASFDAEVGSLPERLINGGRAVIRTVWIPEGFVTPRVERIRDLLL